MKRAGIYARVSTNNGQDPEVQLAEIRQFCKHRDWTTVKEYVDKGISGSKERRPALDNLLTDCRKRAVNCVVVYRYDRFARSLRQLVNALEEFRALGIDFVSLHEGVDTSTPNGRLVFGIFPAEGWHPCEEKLERENQITTRPSWISLTESMSNQR